MSRRIAFISEHASPLALLGGRDSGGQNVYVAEVARELVCKGYRVDVFTRRDDAELPEVVVMEKGIRVIHIDAGPATFVEKEQLLGYMPQFADEMRTFILKNDVRYELIHAHFFMSAMVASIIKSRLSIPYVVTFHALGLVRRVHQKESDRFPKERYDIERFIVRDADIIIAECPQDKQDLIDFYNTVPKKITIIPCGYTKRELQPVSQIRARALLGLPENARIVMHIGRMVARKGVDNIIAALGRLKDSVPGIRLVIVGGESDEPDPAITPEIGRLQQLAMDTGVSNLVHFAGRKSRTLLKYYYSAADVFITTPWYEPFGITPLEAMACGVPVIGSRVGGIQYSVEDGKTGFLVPPKDPDALADKINLILSDTTLRIQMGKNAVRRVNKYFTWCKVAEALLDVYQKTIAVDQLATARAGKSMANLALLGRFSETISRPLLLPRS